MNTLIKNFPPLPESVSKIEELNKDKETPFTDYVKVIENDPLLTANILKKVNSPFYGFSRKIVSIHQAVSLFGKGTIRGMVLSSLFETTMKVDFSPYGMSVSQFQEISLLQNSIVMKWCKKEDKAILDILSTASFLIDIGKLLISMEIIEKKKDINIKEILNKKVSIPSIYSLSAVEKEYTGFSSSSLTSSILDKWCFEEDIIDVIKNINNPKKAQQKNRKAIHILVAIRKSILIDGRVSRISYIDAKDYCQQVSLNENLFSEIMDSHLSNESL